MATWQDEYAGMLDDCEAREDRLSDWEREFVDSLRQQLDDGRRPTVRQVEVLSEVWEKITA